MIAFEILGPLQVGGGAGEVQIKGVRRRALLIRIPVSSNQVVSADLLSWIGFRRTWTTYPV